MFNRRPDSVMPLLRLRLVVQALGLLAVHDARCWHGHFCAGGSAHAADLLFMKLRRSSQVEQQRWRRRR